MNLLENPNIWAGYTGGPTPPDSWNGTSFEQNNSPGNEVQLRLYLIAPYGASGDVVKGAAAFTQGDTPVSETTIGLYYVSTGNLIDSVQVPAAGATEFEFSLPPGQAVFLMQNGGGYGADYQVIPVALPVELIANDDAAITSFNTSVAIDVLANDSIDGEVPTTSDVNVSLFDPPSNGTAEVQPDGSFIYTPNPGFYGTDTFEYEITATGGA